jgi:hypothetical protein
MEKPGKSRRTYQSTLIFIPILPLTPRVARYPGKVAI